MERKVTAEEREILLKNPELVMFNPYDGFKLHKRSAAIAFAPFIIVVICEVLIMVLFGKQFDGNPLTITAAMVFAFLASAAIIPVLYIKTDDRAYRKAESNHYAEQLKKLLPAELMCKRVLVDYILMSKGEGGYIENGQTVGFGFGSFRNDFEILPQSELAIIYGGEKFFGFVKRDPKTESFYYEINNTEHQNG